MDDPTARRAGLNEAAFRRVNESIRSSTTLADADRRFGFVCECAVIGCTAVVELTLPEYERLRSDPRRFVLAPGHELPEIERVVEDTPRFAVVEKTAEAGRVVAEQSDPRAAS